MSVEDVNSIKNELMALIPGFQGYDKVDYRSDSDRVFREFISDKIQLLLDSIRRLVVFSERSLTKDFSLTLQQVLFKADYIVKNLRKEEGIPLKFKERVISSELLNKLLIIDFKILKLTLKIVDLVRDLQSIGIGRPDSILKLKMISEGLDVLASRVKERINFIKEISK